MLFTSGHPPFLAKVPLAGSSTVQTCTVTGRTKKKPQIRQTRFQPRSPGVSCCSCCVTRRPFILTSSCALPLQLARTSLVALRSSAAAARSGGSFAPLKSISANSIRSSIAVFPDEAGGRGRRQPRAQAIDALCSGWALDAAVRRCCRSSW